MSLVRFAKALIKQGFTERGVYWMTFEEGGVYGDGAQKAGERKPNRFATTISFAAVKEGYGYCRLEFEQVNNKGWTCTWRQINGQYKPVSDKELREWIANA